MRVFTLSAPLRLMLGHSEGVDVADVLARNKIVLVPLRNGLLGAESDPRAGHRHRLPATGAHPRRRSARRSVA
ncbi:MAG: hypothetical protein H5T80_10135 [Dietzia sp.]|nr:hypothetical protein [Dietzia sp.]